MNRVAQHCEPAETMRMDEMEEMVMVGMEERPSVLGLSPGLALNDCLEHTPPSLVGLMRSQLGVSGKDLLDLPRSYRQSTRVSGERKNVAISIGAVDSQ